MAKMQTKQTLPPQPQTRQPGIETETRPQSASGELTGCGKLRDKVALITGGDSGIGRAVAIAFAKEVLACTDASIHVGAGTASERREVVNA